MVVVSSAKTFLCLHFVFLSETFVIFFKMFLWSRPHRHSHVATKRTAAKLLFSLGEEGKERNFFVVIVVVVVAIVAGAYI